MLTLSLTLTLTLTPNRFGSLFDARAQAFHQYFYNPSTRTYGDPGSEVLYFFFTFSLT